MKKISLFLLVIIGAFILVGCKKNSVNASISYKTADLSETSIKVDISVKDPKSELTDDSVKVEVYEHSKKDADDSDKEIKDFAIPKDRYDKSTHTFTQLVHETKYIIRVTGTIDEEKTTVELVEFTTTKFPELTKDKPMEISNTEDFLNRLGGYPNGHFIITKDLDFGFKPNSDSTYKYISPMFTTSQPFNGSIIGNGHVLSNITIKGGDLVNVGLFTAISDQAEITDLKFENIQIGIYTNVKISNLQETYYYGVGITDKDKLETMLRDNVLVLDDFENSYTRANIDTGLDEFVSKSTAYKNITNEVTIEIVGADKIDYAAKTLTHFEINLKVNKKNATTTDSPIASTKIYISIGNTPKESKEINTGAFSMKNTYRKNIGVFSGEFKSPSSSSSNAQALIKDIEITNCGILLNHESSQQNTSDNPSKTNTYVTYVGTVAGRTHAKTNNFILTKNDVLVYANKTADLYVGGAYGLMALKNQTTASVDQLSITEGKIQVKITATTFIKDEKQLNTDILIGGIAAESSGIITNAFYEGSIDVIQYDQKYIKPSTIPANHTNTTQERYNIIIGGAFARVDGNRVENVFHKGVITLTQVGTNKILSIVNIGGLFGEMSKLAEAGYKNLVNHNNTDDIQVKINIKNPGDEETKQAIVISHLIPHTTNKGILTGEVGAKLNGAAVDNVAVIGVHPFEDEWIKNHYEAIIA